MQTRSNEKHNKKKEFVEIIHLELRDTNRSKCNRFITWTMKKTSNPDLVTCEVCLNSIGRVFVMPSTPSTPELSNPLKRRISLRIKQLEEQIAMLNSTLLQNKEILGKLNEKL